MAEDCETERVLTEYVALIRRGFTPLEDTARRYAMLHGLASREIDSAVEHAFAQLYDAYVQRIECGDVWFLEDAYETAKRRNYPTERLDAASTRALDGL